MKELRFLLKKPKFNGNIFEFHPEKLALKLERETESELDAWNYYRLGSFSIENLKLIPRYTISKLFLYTCTNVTSIGMTVDHLNKLKNDLDALGLEINYDEWELILLSLEKCNMLCNTEFIASMVKDWKMLERNTFPLFLYYINEKYRCFGKSQLIMDLAQKLLAMNEDYSSILIKHYLDSDIIRKYPEHNASFLELLFSARKPVDNMSAIDDYLLYASTLQSPKINPDFIVYMANNWLRLSQLGEVNYHAWIPASKFLSLAISLKIYHIANPIWYFLISKNVKHVKTTMKFIHCCLAQGKDEEALDNFYQLLAVLVVGKNGNYKVIHPRIHKDFMELAKRYKRIDVFQRHYKVYKMLYPKSRY